MPRATLSEPFLTILQCVQTACDSLLPIVERAFILQLLSGTALEQVLLVSQLLSARSAQS